MKAYKPIIDRFREQFFDGDSCDRPVDKKKPNGATKRAAPKKAIEKEVIHLPDSDEEVDCKMMVDQESNPKSSQQHNLRKRKAPESS